MSNANRKAKGTTMVDKKLAKAKEKIETLEQRLQASQMQTLNMRQVLEATNQEVEALRRELVRAHQMLIGAAIQVRGKILTLKEKTFAKVAEYGALDVTADDGDLVLTPILAEEVEARKAALKEAADEEE